MNDYLYQFASFNLISAHYKVDSLTHEQQTNILTYIMTSIDFVKQINQSYVLFLKEVQKVETGGVPRYSYFFSLDKCKDLSDLQAVSVNKEDARRLTEMWKRAKQNHFDLSNQQQLEQKYGISYRQLCAVLGILLKEKPLPTELENIRMVRENSPIIVVEI